MLDKIFLIGLQSYIVTLIVTSAKIAGPLRNLFSRLNLHGFSGLDFITCRLCVGFWITLIMVSLKNFDINVLLGAYAISYLLAAFEKKMLS